jgi:asparagine synthase (glutamine-hydrolysing)
MSAIAGLWHRDGAPGAKARLGTVLAALRHYGPDARTLWGDGAVAVGCCLRKILPEDGMQAQPISLDGGRTNVVADVRLDNRSELATLLRITPNDAAAMSDASILAHAVAHWGTDCFQYIVGDYSFAAWNSLDQSWLVARDVAGTLPLYFYSNDKIFAFASMPIGLLALAEVPAKVNEESLLQMLELAPPTSVEVTECSGFKHIRRVPAGHFIRIDSRGERTFEHWKPPAELRLKRPEDYYEGLQEHLNRAVACRLRGAGDAASHLSGGLDSSSVAATAAQLQAQRGAGIVAYTSVPQQPCSVEPHNRFSDEREHAAATAALYPNLQHVLITSEGRFPWHSLDSHFLLYQQPLLNLCNNAWISAIHNDVARRNIKVLLTGSLGNFTISFRGLDMLPALITSGQWSELWRLTLALHRRGMSRKFLLASSFAPWIPRTLLMAAKRSPPPPNLLHPDYKQKRRRLPPPSPFASTADHVRWRMFLLQRSDLAAIRKGTLAAWGIDERDPTTDRRLLEFCMSIPAREWMRDGLPSALLRNGLADRLPEKVRYETRKGLQATDWHIEAAKALPQLQEEMRRLEKSPSVNGMIDIPRMRSMMENWPKDDDFEKISTYRYTFLRTLSVCRFLRDAEDCKTSIDAIASQELASS